MPFEAAPRAADPVIGLTLWGFLLWADAEQAVSRTSSVGSRKPEVVIVAILAEQPPWTSGTASRQPAASSLSCCNNARGNECKRFSDAPD